MRALIVYESMYGNTHAVADHIAAGLGPTFDVTVVPAGEATADLVAAADLVVCGGPTHVHGLSSTTSRQSAVTATTTAKGADLVLDPDAGGPGLRDWLSGVTPADHARAAAFDTRVDAPAALTGRAGKGIARRLAKHGFTMIEEPESFLVDKQTHLLDGEVERATAWGAALAAKLSALPGQPSRSS